MLCRHIILVSVLAGLGLFGTPHLAAAQEGAPRTVLSPVVTLDQEKLFNDTLWGKRVATEIAEVSSELAAENRRIEADLTAEEKVLTDRRATLASEDFRAEADKFDQKVTRIRQEQDAKLREIGKRHDADRQAFFRAILPAISDLLTQRGAVAVLDSRAIVLAADAIDITDAMIEKIDAEMGDGSTADGAGTGKP